MKLQFEGNRIPLGGNKVVEQVCIFRKSVWHSFEAFRDNLGSCVTPIQSVSISVIISKTPYQKVLDN